MMERLMERYAVEQVGFIAGAERWMVFDRFECRPCFALEWLSRDVALRHAATLNRAYALWRASVVSAVPCST